MTNIRPPFPYYGGKQRLATKLVNLLPEHDHYVEPFFGGGSVLLAKPRSRHETVNDKDGRVLNFWMQLRDNPKELERLCSLTPHSREELMNSANKSDDPLEDARRLFVLLTQGRSARTGGSTGWRYIIDPNNVTAFSKFVSGYVGRLSGVAERLAGVSLECRDAFDVMDSYDRVGCTMYLDPPYLGSTRTTSVGAYGVEADSIKFHAEFLQRVKALRCSWVLSGYDSELYSDELVGFERHELAARSNGGARTELVWIKG